MAWETIFRDGGHELVVPSLCAFSRHTTSKTGETSETSSRSHELRNTGQKLIEVGGWLCSHKIRVVEFNVKQMESSFTSEPVNSCC